MGMINILAENPRKIDAETQTDVQLGCAYTHLVNTVDSRSLDDLASNGLQSLMAVIARVRATDVVVEVDPFAAALAQTMAGAGLKAKKSVKAKKAAKKTAAPRATGNPVLDELNRIDKGEDRMSLQSLLTETGQQLQEYRNIHSKELAFSDFAAHRFVMSNPTITKAALECYAFLVDLGQKEVLSHPQIVLYCKLAGLYGSDILDSHLVGFLL